MQKTQTSIKTLPVDPDVTVKEVLLNWAQVKESFMKMEQGVLQLMRHPEATGEQIAQARVMYNSAYQQMQQLSEKIAGRVSAGGRVRVGAYGLRNAMVDRVKNFSLTSIKHNI